MLLGSVFYPVLKGVAPCALVICREMWQEAVGAVALSGAAVIVGPSGDRAD